MTMNELTALQAKRDEFYMMANRAREANNWSDECHYHSMARGVSEAITVLFDVARVARQGVAT
jgi:hypothetical protein